MFDERRINRRTAFTVFCKLDSQQKRNPGLVPMMRELVRAFGPDGAMKQCRFPARIPAEAIELQRLCCEYLAFEEGQPDEAALAAECERVQGLLTRASAH